MVAEAVVDQFTGSKPGGKNGARHAPIVARATFGFVDRSGAGKNARHARTKSKRAEATEHVACSLATGLLALEQLVLARHRQSCQCAPTDHARRIDVAQNLLKRR